MTRSTRFVVLGAVLALGVAGCGGADGEPAAAPSASPDATETATPTPSPTATETPTADPTPSPTTSEATATPSPPFTANTDPDTAESTGGPVTVSGIQVSEQDGYDRVVLEIDGPGLPGWRAEYVDEAIEQGSGNEVELAGDAILKIALDNTGYPMDTGTKEYDGPKRLDGARVVTEVVYGAVYEGITETWVGLDAEVPFRVRGRQEPPAVILEFVHTAP